MTGLKLPRTIRLDPSDAFVFERAAEPGEWAVTGGFLFAERDPAQLSRKEQVAFRSGFLGAASFGFSTLVVVAEASDDEQARAVQDLARQLLVRLGAPSQEAAMAAARDEMAVAASICGPPVGTLIALNRSLVDGEIRERFRTLTPREPSLAGLAGLHLGARAWDIVQGEDQPAEEVNLVELLKGSA